MTERDDRYTREGRKAYRNIIRRCSDPRFPGYPQYGAKGILCALSYDEFLHLWFRSAVCELCSSPLDDENRRSRRGRSIDRVDADGPYTTDNCRVICRSCNSKRIRAVRGSAHWTRKANKDRLSGEKNNNHKLTRENVEYIRDQVEGGATQKSLAEEFNVSRALICRIMKGQLWLHTETNELKSV